jgi:hypothetical protein
MEPKLSRDGHVLVVIPARNEAKNLEIVLHRYIDLKLPYDLVVVDGHSTDETRAGCGIARLPVRSRPGAGQRCRLAASAHRCGRLPRLHGFVNGFCQ